MKVEVIEINGNEYCLDIEKALDLGVLKKEPPYDGDRVEKWDEYAAVKSPFCTEITWDNISPFSPEKSDEQEAFEALGKLIQLRDIWWGSWKPNWEDADTLKYIITAMGNKIERTTCYLPHRILAFPTEEMRDEFYECFADLINVAKQFL